MRKYMVYLDSGRNCYKVAVPAENEEAAREYAAGNGEIIAVKDVTEDFPISTDKVVDALRAAGFGEIETAYIYRALEVIGITD